MPEKYKGQKRRIAIQKGYNPDEFFSAERNVTNGDRIRAMSDKELAEWITSQEVFSQHFLPSEWWLDWLQQEVSGV